MDSIRQHEAVSYKNKYVESDELVSFSHKDVGRFSKLKLKATNYLVTIDNNLVKI